MNDERCLSMSREEQFPAETSLAPASSIYTHNRVLNVSGILVDRETAKRTSRHSPRELDIPRKRGPASVPHHPANIIRRRHRAYGLGILRSRLLAEARLKIDLL